MQALPVAVGGRQTYGQILKSSAWIGGSSALNILVGIARSKAMALLLGPAGFGLMGLYASIASLAQSIAGMGISSSGVRQIAAAVGSGDSRKIGRTSAALRRASVLLGLLGAGSLLALSRQVSRLTFDGYEHAVPVALLSLAVLFKVLSDGQVALIQGLRRIPELARIAVFGGLSGAVAGVGLVFLFGEEGVVPALVAMAAASLLFSWRYSRRVAIETPALSTSQLRHESSALLKLGFAFMASAMFATGAAYAVRIIVLREVGFAAAGLYQSAWTIGGLYVGFVLDSMAADFYPRLTAVIRNREECNRLVNEQAQVSLLLAGPGVLATLTLAPLVLPLFYSAAFQEATALLRWLCLGAMLRVITWPMGFIIVAEGKRSIFLGVELAYTVVYLALAWIFVRQMGLNGAGVAFLASYAFHGLLIYPVVRWLTGFRWSTANVRLAGLFLALLAMVFGAFYALPPVLATGIGVLALAANGLYAVRTLVRLASADKVPRGIWRLLAWMRPSATDSQKRRPS